MDTVTLIGRLLVSLAAVLGLMWVIARRARRTVRGTGALVDVLGRRQLSRTASVAVVRVLDQALVLGVTDGQVSLISTLDLDAAQAAIAPESRADAPLPSTAVDEAGRIVAPDAPATRQRPARKARPARTAQQARTGGLAGSALSPDTWRQTLDTLRDLTARSR